MPRRVHTFTGNRRAQTHILGPVGPLVTKRSAVHPGDAWTGNTPRPDRPVRNWAGWSWLALSAISPFLDSRHLQDSQLPHRFAAHGGGTTRSKEHDERRSRHYWHLP